MGLIKYIFSVPCKVKLNLFLFLALQPGGQVYNYTGYPMLSDSGRSEADREIINICLWVKKSKERKSKVKETFGYILLFVRENALGKKMVKGTYRNSVVFTLIV